MKNRKMKIVATVECRMTSSRLPEKVLLEACGKPLLELLVERLKQVKVLDEIVLATTVNSTDDPIVALANRVGIAHYRGSEEDVLQRVLEAARSVNSEIIVEITGDCPLIDPEIVSQVIDLYLMNDCDYASNIDPVSFPIGMDTQVFSRELLTVADREGTSKEDREHVSWFIRRQPERFRKLHLPAPPSLHFPDLGLTLDEDSDYQLIRLVYEHFYSQNRSFTCSEIVRYLRENPDMMKLNEGVLRIEPVS